MHVTHDMASVGLSTSVTRMQIASAIITPNMQATGCMTRAKSITTLLEKVPGLGCLFVFAHVSHDVATLTSEAQPSVNRACKPGNVAGALP